MTEMGSSFGGSRLTGTLGSNFPDILNTVKLSDLPNQSVLQLERGVIASSSSAFKAKLDPTIASQGKADQSE